MIGLALAMAMPDGLNSALCLSTLDPSPRPARMAAAKRKAQAAGGYLAKRNRGIGGQKTWEDGTAREIVVHLAGERAGQYMHSCVCL